MALNAAKIVQGQRAANKEAAARYNERAESAERANLLRPDDVAGDYDANRLMTTTLGGQVRPITREDLQTFKRNAEMLGKAYKGGITAKQVIDRSLDIDRKRAQQEIHVALPTQYSNGKMHFTTNAGPKSDVTRHHVLIEFNNFSAAVASPSKSADLVKLVAGGPIKFGCDCGRHQFWYSYLATIGRFNASVPQLGFPKIRNPGLVGVACKHVLRVMQALGQPLVKQHVITMIEAGRKSAKPKVIAVKKKDAAELAKQQQATIGQKRNLIESTAEKRDRLAQQRAVKALADRRKEARKKVAKPSPEKLEAERKKFEQTARRLASMGGISPEMLADLLSKLKGK